ncbi:MAG: amidohydrolase, partial [Corynebacterium sp.]|nr:amidohydrolase [Corynebacterium sp.]
MTDPTKRIRPTTPGRLAAPRQAQQLPPLPVTRARIGERMATEVFQEMGEEMLEELQNFRRDLHRNPEIGLDLPRTQKKVLEALEGLPLEI